MAVHEGREVPKRRAPARPHWKSTSTSEKSAKPTFAGPNRDPEVHTYTVLCKRKNEFFWA